MNKQEMLESIRAYMKAKTGMDGNKMSSEEWHLYRMSQSDYSYLERADNGED